MSRIANFDDYISSTQYSREYSQNNIQRRKNNKNINHRKKRKKKQPQRKPENKRRRKKKRIRINPKFLLFILFLIIIITIIGYIYSKKDIIINEYNEIKKKIEIKNTPDEYWRAINDVYVSDDILLSIPMGIYYDSVQKNTCAVKVPRNATMYAECRYSDMKNYMFNVADGTNTTASAIEQKILETNIAIRHIKLEYPDSNTIMEYTVYSLDDGKYSTISTLNPDAAQIGDEKHPAVAYYTQNSIFDYDLYMYYYIDEETTMHICYSGPLSDILSAKQLGECIYNMIDEYNGPDLSVNEKNIDNDTEDGSDENVKNLENEEKENNSEEDLNSLDENTKINDNDVQKEED